MPREKKEERQGKLANGLECLIHQLVACMKCNAIQEKVSDTALSQSIIINVLAHSFPVFRKAPYRLHLCIKCNEFASESQCLIHQAGSATLLTFFLRYKSVV
jgi:hypothetical protein